MALPDFTGQNIEDTYQRVLHTDGTRLFNGTGSIVGSLNLDVNTLDVTQDITATNITASGDISASGTVQGGGLSIDGPSNAHIEVGEYPVGFDTLGLNTLYITGSGLIISGAMADANHHNMLKIGDVELLDVNTAITKNQFLIHNVTSFAITSGSDVGSIVAGAGNTLFLHRGDAFFLCKDGENTANATIKSSATATTISDTDIVINAVNGPIIRALNSTTATYLAGFDADPNNAATENVRSIAMSNIYPLLGGAITASAISSSGTITATSFVGTMDGGSF